MASIVPGYEYDIFISYRQKDNKGDRWVSEFVDALKTELESTFKEEISIYFDENSHDGLLETYDVDASLKEKLKCLIFIPIISRTYCDPNSFAWEHEFKAFIDQATSDRFGLRTTLPNRNVTSRALPVRIHELDIDDIKLCETILGGVIRGVDFIYKAAGVNRPLRANEDHPKDNLNKTYYRDQINKVANAIEEIIKSLRGDDTATVNKKSLSKDQEKESKMEINKNKQIDIKTLSPKSKKGLAVLLILLLSVLIVFTVYKLMNQAVIENTIAIIPLQNENEESTLTENGDILMDAIREKLQTVKRIALIPRISCLQYRNTKKSISTIRKELNANYLIAGNIGHEANKTSIGIELIKTRANKQLWFQKYVMDKNQIIRLSNDIVRNITTEMNYVLSTEEKNRLEMSPTKNDEAYRNYITANGISGDNWFYYNMGNKLFDSTCFKSAVLTYEKALKNDSLFALAYAKRAIARSWGFYIGQFDSSQIDKCWKDIEKALEIDKDLTEAQNALGFYYYYCKSDCNNALKHFKIAADQDPGNYQPLFYMAIVYRKMGDWKKSQSLINRVIKLNPQESLFLTNIGLSYEYLRNYDSALIYHQKAIDVMPSWSSPYKNKIETYILKNGNTADGWIVLDSGMSKTGENFNEHRILLNIYEGKNKEALNLAEKSVPEDFEIHGDKYIHLARINGYLKNARNVEKYYDSALVVLNHQFVLNPAKSYLRSYIGVAFAGRGYKEKAMEEIRNTLDLISASEPDKYIVILNLAQICVMQGDYDNAFRNIEILLNNPSCFSTKLLLLDPFWKPLAKLPEFQSLIKKYSEN